MHMRVCVYARVSGASISVDLLVAFFFILWLISSLFQVISRPGKSTINTRLIIHVWLKYWQNIGLGKGRWVEKARACFRNCVTRLCYHKIWIYLFFQGNDKFDWPRILLYHRFCSLVIHRICCMFYERWNLWHTYHHLEVQTFCTLEPLQIQRILGLLVVWFYNHSLVGVENSDNTFRPRSQ